ncbi:hypothetical protein ABIA32_005792 [Streptacidiphilus sp. MAP12-20]|uniref:hypothetical protein n=1 Tax=Streptacidiphilus sp. MAP12-20 TaxID=3156299 RepID=UPI00351471E4
MTSLQPPNQNTPVFVGPYDTNSSDRNVVVCRADGSLTAPQPCRSPRAMHRFVEHERPDTDLDDPTQIYWADHPGKWPHEH